MFRLAAETAAELAPWWRLAKLGWKLRRNLALLALLGSRRNRAAKPPRRNYRPAEIHLKMIVCSICQDLYILQHMSRYRHVVQHVKHHTYCAIRLHPYISSNVACLT